MKATATLYVQWCELAKAPRVYMADMSDFNSVHLFKKDIEIEIPDYTAEEIAKMKAVALRNAKADIESEALTRMLEIDAQIKKLEA